MSPSEKISFFVIVKLSAKERQSAELNGLYVLDNVRAGLLKYCQGILEELIVTVDKKCHVLSLFLIKLAAESSYHIIKIVTAGYSENNETLILTRICRRDDVDRIVILGQLEFIFATELVESGKKIIYVIPKTGVEKGEALKTDNTLILLVSLALMLLAIIYILFRRKSLTSFLIRLSSSATSILILSI